MTRLKERWGSNEPYVLTHLANTKGWGLSHNFLKVLEDYLKTKNIKHISWSKLNRRDISCKRKENLFPYRIRATPSLSNYFPPKTLSINIHHLDNKKFTPLISNKKGFLNSIKEKEKICHNFLCPPIIAPLSRSFLGTSFFASTTFFILHYWIKVKF